MGEGIKLVVLYRKTFLSTRIKGEKHEVKL